jgi:IS4 transposase
MKGLPRGTFDKAVKRHNGDKYSKRFKHWNHLIAMLYGQLSGVTELRPLTIGFNSHVAHHYHLGASEVKRSTLADANERRSDAVFKDVAVSLMQTLSRKVRQECEDLMYLLDSTSITLKGREFDSWTLADKTRYTQGIKLHVLMNAHGNIPVWTEFSAANVNDIERAWDIKIEKGACYVFDKGYNDYNWWNLINRAEATFVTRFKSNASVKIIETLDIEDEAAGIVLADEIVSFKHRRPGGKRINLYYGEKLRRITIARPGKKPIVLATNDFKSTALEIAQRYKERWGIELFFKWIKQHLRIKKFMGRSENAVRIQILSALISYLLVAIYQKGRDKLSKLSRWECLCLIRATLFQRSDPPEESRYRKRRQAEEQYAKNQGCLFA